VKTVRFSEHALEKFDMLARHGFKTTREAVIEALLSPDRVESDQNPPIAQRRVSEHTVLRVVYTETESANAMKIKYSRDVDILTLELHPSAQINHAEHVGQAIIHLTPDHQPVLIEILQARDFVTALVEAVMQPDATPVAPQP
jgi:hypothetical protein